MKRALAFLVIAALAGCAVPTQYMGIALSPGAAPTELQGFAEQALSGNKAAQLALGVAYEEGQGVAVDLKRARTLYRLAAANSGGTIYVYQPPVRKGGRGGVIPVNLGPVVAGLAKARARLAALKANENAARRLSPE